MGLRELCPFVDILRIVDKVILSGILTSLYIVREAAKVHIFYFDDNLNIFFHISCISARQFEVYRRVYSF